MIKIFLGIIIVILAVMNFSSYAKTMELEKEIKIKNEIIEIDNQLIQKHEREIELYGDFIIAILKGEDKKRILTKEEVLKAGEKITEIKKEVEELARKRGDLK